MTAAAHPTKTRDAERSRRLILDAAENVFARQGFDAATLADIGQIAGVSRGTPSYFFGSKEALYRAVLERMYADRTEALEPVFAPLGEWAREAEPSQPLRAVLSRSIEGYVRFLRDRPTYVEIIEREALAGGERLTTLENQSTVMEDVFGVLRRRAKAHGLRNFDVAEVIVCLVALGYMPVAHRDTMGRRQGWSIEDQKFVAKRTRHITDVLLHLLGAAE